MQIKYQLISDQFEQGYFTFSKKEVNDFFENVQDEENIIEDVKCQIETAITNAIESSLLSYVNFKFFNKIERNHGLIVLAQYCIFPDNIPLELPSLKLVSDQKVLSAFIERYISKLMMNTSGINGKDVDAVTTASIVIYDLEYIYKDEVVHCLPEQALNVLTSDNADCLKFIDHKLNDKILIDDNNEEIKIVAVIKRIVDYNHKNLTDEDTKKINLLEITTAKELYRKVAQIITYAKLVDKYIDFLLSYYQNKGIIKINNEVINFFKKSLNLADDDEISLDEIERDILKQMIGTEISQQEDYELNFDENVSRIKNEFALLCCAKEMELTDYFSFYHDRLVDFVIIEYCSYQGIINLKY